MTPLEKLMDYMEQNQYFIGNGLLAKYKELLEEEKEVMCGIYDDAIAQFDPTYIGTEKYGEQYYNEIFNTEER
jgi:hypothetical protein